MAKRPSISRVVVYEFSESGGESVAAQLFDCPGCELIRCRDGAALLEEMVRRRPDLVVYGLRPSCDQDLGVLQLLRGIQPDVPLVLVAAEDSLVTQKMVHDLRPIYYAVRPVDSTELREVLHAVLVRRSRQSSHVGHPEGP